MSTFKCKCHWCGADLIRCTQAKKVALHFCDTKCKGEYQKTKKPVTKSWLEDHYITKRLDTTQIGHLVGRDPKSVWNWLKDFGIPTRPRGGNTLPHAFKKGDNAGEKNPFYGRKHSKKARDKLRRIAKADGRMPFKAENGPPWKGKGGEGHPSWKGGITPERQAFYSTQEWKAVARKVKRRDKKTCQLCGKIKTSKDGCPFDIHHIVPFECVELRAEITNLVYLCEPCHYWVHGDQNDGKVFIKEIPNVG
jgi:hypothetical protein